MLNNTHELELAHEIAYARLGVAEELGWFIAILAAVLVGDRYGWLLGFLTFAVSYYFSTHFYRKESDLTQDAYYKAAGLGAYSYAHRKEQDSDESASGH